MDVQPAGTQIHITLEGDEAFDLLQFLHHEGVYRRTAEALCERLWALGYVKPGDVPRDLSSRPTGRSHDGAILDRTRDPA